MKRCLSLAPIMASAALAGGCRHAIVQRTDNDVYRLIGERQRAAVGLDVDSEIPPPDTGMHVPDRAYGFTPQPRTGAYPEGFQPVPLPADEPPVAPAEADAESAPPTEEADQEPTAETVEMTADIFTPEQRPHVTTMSLADAMAYAMKHSREFQDAKEDLYLAALDLTLERHLWTPQFVASVTTRYDDFEAEDTLDRAMSTISEVSLTQQLPYGGDVTARVIHTLVRDVSRAVAKGESGQAILSANIPLLRGAGKTAYESRYAAERELVYAVRQFERFRRGFLVDIARDFFSLQESKAAILNTHISYLRSKEQSDKAEFKHRVGQSRSIDDAPRAKAQFRGAEARLVQAKEGYESALDRFKIRLAMPIDALLDVVSQQEDQSARAVDALLPDVDEATAVAVALEQRLDLLINRDRVDDRRRGVSVAANRVLPNLDLSGDVIMNSDPAQLRPTSLRSERTSWNAGLTFRIDDRKTERNAYRESLINLRRAERDHEEFADTVRADVRRARRQIHQQRNLRTIQALNVAENETRLAAAIAQNDLGLATNQAVVDAEGDLLDARNSLAAAIADYRVAILNFRRDTGTLRVTDDGRWAPAEMLDLPEPEAGDDGG